MKNRNLFIFIFLLIFLLIIGNSILNHLKRSDLKSYSNESLKLTKLAYKSVLELYENLAKKDFEIIIDKNVTGLLNDFNNVEDEKQKNIIRGYLYRYLYKDYNHLKNEGIRQFHFHTKDIKSLLRFHNPYNSEDNLSKVRKSILLANKNKTSYHGFEGGRVFPGFRNVFSIVENSRLLATVELSVSFDAIAKKLAEVLPSYSYVLLMDKESTMQKVFKPNQKNFVKSKLIDRFYIENEKLSDISSTFLNDELIKKLNNKMKISKSFYSKHIKNKDFSMVLNDKENGYVINFIAVKNFENSFVGYLVAYFKSDDVYRIFDKYKKQKALMLLFVIILVFLIYYAYNQRVETLEKKNSLEKTNKNLQSILDYQKNAIIIFDMNNVYKNNNEFLEIFEIKEIELENKGFDFILKLFEDRIESNSLNQIDTTKFKGAFFNKNLNFINNKIVSFSGKNSKIEHFLIDVNTYDINKFILVLTNVTELLKLQKVVVSQSRIAAIGEMIGNIAHQWRQPLSVISTAATGLKFKLDYLGDIDNKELSKTLESINSQSQYLSKTIDDFRDFFKSSDNNSKKYISSKAIIEKSLNVTRDALQNNHIKIEQKVEDFKFETYDNLLVQALINIINNTKDAITLNNIDIENRRIILECYAENNIKVFKITDFAGGINEDLIEKVFEPYFTTKHNSIGTGIGLYMTHQIIKKHLNGDIVVKNIYFQDDKKVTKGVSFKILLNC